MEQLSIDLANDIENGFTFGIPENLIQIYRELSAWCELIQYKIYIDVNTRENIRKQVLSNNLLKHVQDLWKQKVKEFYIKYDETGDNNSKAFQDGINDEQNIKEEIKEEEKDNCNNDNIDEEYIIPTSVEEDKMIAVIKYEAIPKVYNVNVEDVCECNYSDINYNSNIYDDYNLDNEPNYTIIEDDSLSSYESDSNDSSNDFLNSTIFNSDYDIYTHIYDDYLENIVDNEEDNIKCIDQMINEQRKISISIFNASRDNPINNYENLQDLENPSIDHSYKFVDNYTLTDRNTKEKKEDSVEKSNKTAGLSITIDKDEDENLYSRTVNTKDLYNEKYNYSPTTDSIVSLNEELLLSSLKEEMSQKDYSESLSTDVTLNNNFYSCDNADDTSNEISDNVDDSSDKISDNVDDSSDKISDNVDDSSDKISKYLSTRRDSGFSETSVEVSCN